MPAGSFPPCSAGRAGQRQLLETVITRSDGAPLSGWLVRYEMLEGPEAAFSARGDTVAQVRTDGAGRATAELLPRSTMPGITTIGIQVIRPASGPGDLPEMVVGQGTTAVNWSTPGLSVTAIGTGTVSADGAISYRVEVMNNGDLLTTGVVLSYTPPTGVTRAQQHAAGPGLWPAVSVDDRRFARSHDQRRRGQLPCVGRGGCTQHVPGGKQRRYHGRGTSDNARLCQRTFGADEQPRCGGSRPRSAVPGRRHQHGTTTLTGVVASDTFDPGLAHTGGGASPLRRALDPIGPGETRRIALNFIVTQPGRQTHRLDVTADGGHASRSARRCHRLTRSERPPSGPSVPGGSSSRHAGCPTAGSGSQIEWPAIGSTRTDRRLFGRDHQYRHDEGDECSRRRESRHQSRADCRHAGLSARFSCAGGILANCRDSGRSNGPPPVTAPRHQSGRNRGDCAGDGDRERNAAIAAVG